MAWSPFDPYGSLWFGPIRDRYGFHSLWHPKREPLGPLWRGPLGPLWFLVAWTPIDLYGFDPYGPVWIGPLGPLWRGPLGPLCVHALASFIVFDCSIIFIVLLDLVFFISNAS